jgi:hypothetical protein
MNSFLDLQFYSIGLPVRHCTSFSAVAGYKINSNKPMDFLYTKLNRLREKLGKQDPSK